MSIMHVVYIYNLKSEAVLTKSHFEEGYKKSNIFEGGHEKLYTLRRFSTILIRLVLVEKNYYI